jgi:hypothetical protein
MASASDARSVMEQNLGVRAIGVFLPRSFCPRALVRVRQLGIGVNLGSRLTPRRREGGGGLKQIEVHAVRISFQSPWQNGIAERWVGSCRRELLDHVILLTPRQAGVPPIWKISV